MSFYLYLECLVRPLESLIILIKLNIKPTHPLEGEKDMELSVYNNEAIIKIDTISDPTQTLDFLLPNSTNYVKSVEIKEIAIGIGAPDIGSDLRYIGIEILAPRNGLENNNGNIIYTTPGINNLGDLLYRHYQGENLELFKLNSKISREKNLNIKLNILKMDNTKLSMDFFILDLMFFIMMVK